MNSVALRTGIRRSLRGLRRLANSLGDQRECTLCGWRGRRFEVTGEGAKRRPDALCPNCGSVERHRLAHALLRNRLSPGQRTLHVAPEPSVTAWLNRISDSYVSIDLDAARAMRAMDLTALDIPDSSVSLVYCSHVLEHIPDDRDAMAEMVRVLEPGGWAIVQVPIRGDHTDEDPSVTDPEERLHRFHQRDHVRVYGLDIIDRLTGAGFAVEVLDDSALPQHSVQRGRLVWRTTRQVFLCSPTA
jgi:SAM-dependent methyltransferase